jgi:hypothetical protein
VHHPLQSRSREICLPCLSFSNPGSPVAFSSQESWSTEFYTSIKFLLEGRFGIQYLGDVIGMVGWLVSLPLFKCFVNYWRCVLKLPGIRLPPPKFAPAGRQLSLDCNVFGNPNQPSSLLRRLNALWWYLLLSESSGHT